MEKEKDLLVLESFKSILSTRNFGKEAAKEYKKRISARTQSYRSNRAADKASLTRDRSKTFDALSFRRRVARARKRTIGISGTIHSTPVTSKELKEK